MEAETIAEKTLYRIVIGYMYHIYHIQADTIVFMISMKKYRLEKILNVLFYKDQMPRILLLLLSLLLVACVIRCKKCQCRFSTIPRVANQLIPVPNGCGAKTKGDYVPELWFNSCCQKHDVCYGVCNSNKFICDAEFYTCMKQTCAEKTKGLKKLACKKAASLYNLAVVQMGCSAWIQNQNKYCTVSC